MNSFGIFIQVVMILSAFIVVYLFRYFESPKRKIVVWMLDVSKIGAAQILGHSLNIVFALWLTPPDGDSCSYYFQGIIIQDTLSICLVYVYHQSFIYLLNHPKLDCNVVSGNYIKSYHYYYDDKEYEVTKANANENEYLYNTDPAIININSNSKDLQEYHHAQFEYSEMKVEIDYAKYTTQLVLWLFCYACSKFTLLGLQLSVQGFMLDISNSILNTNIFVENPRFMLIFVMIITPVSLTTLQFLVFDYVIKFKSITITITSTRSRSRIKGRNNENRNSKDLDEDLNYEKNKDKYEFIQVQEQDKDHKQKKEFETNHDSYFTDLNSNEWKQNTHSAQTHYEQKQSVLYYIESESEFESEHLIKKE